MPIHGFDISKYKKEKNAARTEDSRSPAGSKGIMSEIGQFS